MRSDLPTGTVTFLFTDVEGSTRLLHELGAEAYAEALSEHRLRIREACTQERGVEVDTQGDAFLFAFPTAPGALTAAAAFTDALEPGLIHVRVGLHTGTPHLGSEGYVGEDVHMGARIAASAHGGQVVCSRVTRDLSGLALVDLGEHRLKDIAEPVSIYQLGAERFPPLNTLSNTNLPTPTSSFVGRERELTEVVSLVRDGARLLTLSGPGGSGKTRVAIEAASELVSDFGNAVVWVPLATLRDSALVTETIARTLGASDGLADHIGKREMLLLLDNLEQVVDAASDLSALLAECPALQLLVTSRELLRIQGEVEYSVPPLAEREAVELFCARSGLEPSTEIGELCRRLDSLPLAVELAAARTRALTPQQILDRLSRQLDLLKGGRDADPRQQTLRATIAWSYDLLDFDERELFGRLAVFVGGCTVEAAEEVCDADLDTLQSLVEKSLLRFTNGRYWMLEMIREFAAERLDESGDPGSVRRRFVEHVGTLAEQARQHLVGGKQLEWMAHVDVERDNVRGAFALAIDRGQPELQLAAATALERFWWARGAGEGLFWLERGLDEVTAQSQLRGSALAAAGSSAYLVGDYGRALTMVEEALFIARELDDRAAIAASLVRLASPLAIVGRIDEAISALEEALPIQRELGIEHELALSLHILGSIALERRDYARADELLRESATIARGIGDTQMLVWDLHNLGEAALNAGELRRAWSLCGEALALAYEIRDDLCTLICLRILSRTALKLGEGERAGRLWGVAEQLDEKLGASLVRSEQPTLEDELGESTPEFERGREEGRTFSLGDAVALALDSVD